MFTIIETQKNRVTPYEYALMSQAAYLKTTSIEISEIQSLQAKVKLTQLGWEELSSQPVISDVGYCGIAYRHPVKKHIVISHRGTDFKILQNILSDLQIAILELPESQKYAKHFSESIRALDPFKEYSYSETGHSLAAIYAESNAKYFNCQAVTFDSPGCMEILSLSDADQDNIINYVSAPDLVNTCGTHPKNTVRIFVPHINLDGLSVDDFKKKMANINLFTSGLLIVFSCNPVAVYAFLKEVFTKIVDDLKDTIMFHEGQMHSMCNILSCFNPMTGQPTLQRQVISWPSCNQYFCSWLPKFQDIIQYLKNSFTFREALSNLNRRCEEELNNADGYKIGNFLISNLVYPQYSLVDMNIIIQSSLQVYGEFYGSDRETFQKLANRLNQFKSTVPWAGLITENISLTRLPHISDSIFHPLIDESNDQEDRDFVNECIQRSFGNN
ncbi:MAG: hypothetical protein K0R24_23 [Gammaproteobacteria bacterium]|jgi:hypothetical protein|nr:hypothetical protein [Gammaproteobacteria bacterium]